MPSEGAQSISMNVQDGFSTDDRRTRQKDSTSSHNSEKELAPTPRTGMSWSECFFQILISIQGPTAFLLPSGFKTIGYLACILGSFGVVFFYLYCTHLYLWCESEVRKRKDVSAEKQLNIFSIIELTFAGSQNKKLLAKCLNQYLKYEIIISWSLTLSFGQIFLCDNIRLILSYFGYEMTNWMILIMLFPFSTLVSWIPNLKVMAFVSFMSCFVLVLVMLQIVYIIFLDPAPLPQIQMIGEMGELGTFLGTLVSAMVCTPLLFPLKNEMKQPRSLSSSFGSWNASLLLFVTLNVSFSFFCYIKFGNNTSDNILYNLPLTLPLVISNGLVAVTVIVGAGPTFFVIFETIWGENLRKLCSNSDYELFYEYVARTFLNLSITVIAVAMPSLDILVNLISCFSYPFDSVLLPLLLHMVLICGKENRGTSFPFLLLLHSALAAICIFFSTTMFLAFLSGVLAAYSPSKNS